MVHIIYISKDGNTYDSNPVFSDIAAKIQVADIPPNKLIYVSKDGNNYDSNPVFSGIAAKIQVVDLEKKGNKTLYVSKDGTTYQPNPIYNDAAKNFLIELLVAPTPPIQPPIQKPPEGHVKEGGWGGNQDPITWSIVSMQDEPTMFKIV